MHAWQHLKENIFDTIFPRTEVMATASMNHDYHLTQVVITWSSNQHIQYIMHAWQHLKKNIFDTFFPRTEVMATASMNND
jgi:hypothetical protein